MASIEMTIEEIEIVAALVRFTAIAHPNLVGLEPDIFQSIYDKMIAAAKISPEVSKFSFKEPHDYYDEIGRMTRMREPGDESEYQN